MSVKKKIKIRLKNRPQLRPMVIDSTYTDDIFYLSHVQHRLVMA